MTISFKQNLLKAASLTRSGQLMDATRLIQQTLAGASAAVPEPSLSPVTTARPHTTAHRAANDARVQDAQVIDVVARLVAEPVSTDVSQEPAKTDPAQPVVGDARDAAITTPSRFLHDRFVFEGVSYPYRLFVPAVAPSRSGELPLVVLLHGCKQDASDFAVGTAMNTLAGAEGCLVLYPEQVATGNAQMCWNWFEPAHQRAGQGESGMVAALTAHVLAQPLGHYAAGCRADPARVYIAGLSAGGAMAAVVATAHPELFAAVGVHSGLPSGAARDMVSAFGAMGRGSPGGPAAALPTIVFHGSADGTVHPSNGDSIAQAAARALQHSGVSLRSADDQPARAGRSTQRTTNRTTHRAQDGTPFVEQWRVTSGPHAWSGGDAAGSYTDPTGPSASAAMLAFFLRHRKA